MAQNYTSTTIQQGVSFGSALAIVISFTTHHSTDHNDGPSFTAFFRGSNYIITR